MWGNSRFLKQVCAKESLCSTAVRVALALWSESRPESRSGHSYVVCMSREELMVRAAVRAETILQGALRQLRELGVVREKKGEWVSTWTLVDPSTVDAHRDAGRAVERLVRRLVPRRMEVASDG